ncbi:MAG: hypothetical protein KGL39_33180 [Patescibacteria group bacterium]|nr:hypothetical protein [Patescibacteria group bacterium]
MVYFHNEAATYPDYQLTLDELIQYVGSLPDGKVDPSIFLSGLGFAITSIEMSDSSVQDAMTRLADAGQGKVPSTQAPFFKALSDQAQDLSVFNYIEVTPSVMLQTAKQIGTGLQSVGNAVITTGKTLTQIGPVLIVAAVVFIGWSYTARAAGS